MKSINPYLMFDGNCREAMTFYKGCFDAELHMMPFSAAPPDSAPPPGASDRIMHAMLMKGPVALMASDTQPGQPSAKGDNFSININCESLDEIEKFFKALGEKGTVTCPLQDMFWGARFGMLKDQFGIHWMFNFEHPKKA